MPSRPPYRNLPKPRTSSVISPKPKRASDASDWLVEDLLEQEALNQLALLEANPKDPSGVFTPVECPDFHLPARQDIGNAPLRMVKVLIPVCNADKMRALGLPETEACQRGLITPRNWFETCPHEPYMNFATRTARRPVTEPILDDAGNPTGRHRIVRYEEETWVEKNPNTRQVAVNRRINSNLGLNDALMKGARLPSTPFCDYIECYAQSQSDGSPLLKTKFGNYCNEMQARYVAADARQIKLFTDDEKRYEQIMGVSLT